MRRILPTLLALLTGHDRYFPEIEWSDGSWTHNVFRVYEMVFGRRVGIKAEMVTICQDGKVTYYARSWEASFAIVETYIRLALRSLKPAPFKIYIPILWTPQGIPVIASPYLFAIALDAVSTASGFTAPPTNTFAATITGTNPILWVAGFNNGTTDDITSAVWNGSETMTKTDSKSISGGAVMDLFYRIAPTTGTHNVVVSYPTNTWQCLAISYTGATQTAIDLHNTFTSGAVLTYTQTLVTGVDNAWMIWMVADNAGRAHTAGTNTTNRFGDSSSGVSVADTNGAQTPTGNHNMSETSSSGSPSWASLYASFGPYVAPSGPANWKTYNTNVKANIKTLNTNTLANIKTYDTIV